MARSLVANRAPLAPRAQLGQGPVLPVGQAPGGIHLVTDMFALVNARRDEARSIARGELGAAALRVFERAQREWPVDTGYSRSRLQMRRQPDEGTGLGERFQISLDAWYAGYIRRHGVHVVTDLLRNPLQVEVRKAAQEIADRLEQGQVR